MKGILEAIDTLYLTAIDRIFRLRPPLVCPDCKSRVENPTDELVGFPEMPSVEVIWECPCCEETTWDPEWAGFLWPFNTIIPHLRWRLRTTWQRLQEYEEWL